MEAQRETDLEGRGRYAKQRLRETGGGKEMQMVTDGRRERQMKEKRVRLMQRNT